MNNLSVSVDVRDVVRKIVGASRAGDFTSFSANMGVVVGVGENAWNHPLVRSVLPMLPRHLVSGFTSEIRRRGGGYASWGKPCFHDDNNLADSVVAPSSVLQGFFKSVVAGGEGRVPRNISDYGIDFAGLDRIIGSMSATPALTRRLVVDRGESFIVSDSSGFGKTMVVCMGFSDVPMLDLVVLDTYLSAYGWSAVYLRDHTRSGYQLGMDGAGLDEMLARIHSALDRLGTRRINIVGTSFGGLGAVLIGRELNPGRIDLFSPVVRADKGAIRAIGDTRGAVAANYLERNYPDLVFDAGRLAGDSLAGVVVNAYVGDRMELDKRQMGLWRGVSVNLNMINGCAQHNCLVAAMAVQPLEDILGLDL